MQEGTYILRFNKDEPKNIQDFAEEVRKKYGYATCAPYEKDALECRK